MTIRKRYKACWVAPFLQWFSSDISLIAVVLQTEIVLHTDIINSHVLTHSLDLTQQAFHRALCGPCVMPKPLVIRNEICNCSILSVYSVCLNYLCYLLYLLNLLDNCVICNEFTRCVVVVYVASPTGSSTQHSSPRWLWYCTTGEMCTKPWDFHWQWCVYENPHLEDCLELLRCSTSALQHPDVSQPSCTAFISHVTHYDATRLW